MRKRLHPSWLSQNAPRGECEREADEAQCESGVVHLAALPAEASSRDNGQKQRDECAKISRLGDFKRLCPDQHVHAGEEAGSADKGGSRTEECVAGHESSPPVATAGAEGATRASPSASPEA